MQANYQRVSPVCENPETDSRSSSMETEDTDPHFEMPFDYGLKPNETPTKEQREQQRATQKAISKWFDSHPSAHAPDIYEPEWQERIASWQKCTDDMPCSPTSNTPDGSNQWLSGLEFDKFFVAHPIPSISLWNLLQALYELDTAVCKDSDAVITWREMTPFAYLTARRVENEWGDSLKGLKRRLLNCEILSVEIVCRHYDIRCSMDKVEEVLAELRENFMGNLKDENFTQKMLDEIEQAANWRFIAIDKSLEFSKENLEVIRKKYEKQELEENFKHEQQLISEYGNMNPLSEFPPRISSRSSRRNSMREYVMILSDAPRGLRTLCVALIALLVAYFIRSYR